MIHILLNTLAITAIFIAVNYPGMIFDFIPKWFAFLPEKVKKPIFSCLTCMGFWYGLILGSYVWEIDSITNLFFSGLATSGLCFLTCVLLEKTTDYGC